MLLARRATSHNNLHEIFVLLLLRHHEWLSEDCTFTGCFRLCNNASGLFARVISRLGCRSELSLSLHLKAGSFPLSYICDRAGGLSVSHPTMDQWQPYSNAPGGPRRFNSTTQAGQTHGAREYNGSAQPLGGFTYEQYQIGTNNTLHGQSMAASPSATSNARDGNGDVAMQDAGDPYSGIKYPIRPHHQQHLSAGGRSVSHQSPPEPSTAAQRYSPMETLSPTTSHTTGQNPYNSRHSPTRPGSYSSPNSYYANRPQAQQLPPITPYSSNHESYPPSAVVQLNAVFGNDPKSPRRQIPQSQGPTGRGPVPEFTKVTSISELQPKINAQPAFRRANPEGGFISVRTSNTVLSHLLMLLSLYKRSPLIYHRHTAYAILASSTNHLGTHAGYLRNRAKAPKMTASTTKIVTISYM